MYPLDVEITRAINDGAGALPFLDFLMPLISSFGIPVIVGCVALQWRRRSGRPQIRFAAISAGLAFICGLGVNQLILLVVDRVRPYDAGVTHLLVSPSGDPSFPSDHATAAFAVAFAFLFSGLRREGAALFVAALVLAVSRVYIGIHYAGDVVGGALIGILAAIAVHLVYRESSRLNKLLTSFL